jgi:hypothetical protein
LRISLYAHLKQFYAQNQLSQSAQGSCFIAVGAVDSPGASVADIPGAFARSTCAAYAADWAHCGTSSALSGRRQDHRRS